MFHPWLISAPRPIASAAAEVPSRSKNRWPTNTPRHSSCPTRALQANELTKVAEKQNKAGDGLAAKTSLASAAVAAKEVTDPASRATCLSTVAAAMCRLEQVSDAKPLFSEAAKAIEEIKDADAKITPLISLASSTGTYLKNPEQAAEYLKKAEAAADAIGNSDDQSPGPGPHRHRILASFLRKRTQSESPTRPWNSPARSRRRRKSPTRWPKSLLSSTT